MNEKVSIVIPFYNGDYLLLHRAIRSLLNSTYKNIEIILVDDGSIEFRGDEFESYNNKVVVIHNNSNLGISAARNKGVMASTGEWVMWLDHDDYIDEDCIYNLIHHSQNKLMVMGTCIVYEKDRVDRKNPKLFFDINKTHYGTIYDSFLCNVFSLQPQIVKKGAFCGIGGFNKNYRYAEMTEFFLRFIVRYGMNTINICDNAYYHYDRSRVDSVSKNRKLLEEFRKKALLYYARELKIEVDSIEYYGRSTNTQTQIYLPKKSGCIYSPSYLRMKESKIVLEDL